MKTRDVLGFGCTALDELIYVEEWPDRDRKIPIQRLESQGGGLGATALIAAARMGASCAYAGMLGFDAASERASLLMEDEGIDLDLVTWREGAGPVRAFVVVDTTHHSRNIFLQRPALLGTPPDAPSEVEIAASRCVFLDHYGGSGNVRACELARKHRVPVVADFERTDVPAWEEFFPLVDHLILSSGFAARLTGEDSPQGCARALWNPNRQAVIVTCGEAGAWATTNGRSAALFPGFPTEVADTTGCGDCFHGVYCATLAWGWPLETRLQWANAAASLKARVVGAQRGLPTRDAVEALLAEVGRI